MTVIVVGPGTVTAPAPVDPELVRTALEAIDDRLAVFDDEIVGVDELWCRVALAAVGEPVGRATLVVSSHWPAARVERVEAALLTVCRDVVVRHRGDVLRALAPVVVDLGSGAAGADEILESVSGAAAVVLDVPAGVTGLDALALELERRLERRGVEVIRADDEAVRIAAGADPPASRPKAGAARLLAAVAAVIVTAALAGAAMRAPPEQATWIFEGRVAIEVGAKWAVQRITNGPGSARVQTVSPDGAVTVHLTQAAVPSDETRESTARALEAALGRQPGDVFTDFNPADSAAGRAAVTYREVRSGVVDWTVLVDDGVRIAIGCRDGTDAPRRAPACQRAIRTARAVREFDGTDRGAAASN